MSNLKEIRSRTQSVKNTQKITKAMKMVSAAKLRKAKNNTLQLSPYANHIRSLMARIAASESSKHPLLQTKKKINNVLLVVVSSDRGLCGSFNSNITKYVNEFLQNNTYKNVEVYSIGKKTETSLTKKPLRSILNLSKDISYEYANDISKELLNFFLNGEYDEIRFVYNKFISAISQEQTQEPLLPLDLSLASNKNEKPKDILFEPDSKKLIESLIKKHFGVHVYRVLSESLASEHAARMTAMENATNNANQMIETLTLTYNKLRQASITRELIEICSGAEAVQS